MFLTLVLAVNGAKKVYILKIKLSVSVGNLIYIWVFIYRKNYK